MGNYRKSLGAAPAAVVSSGLEGSRLWGARSRRLAVVAGAVVIGLFAHSAVGQAERVYWQDVQNNLVNVMEPDGDSLQVVLQADSIFRGIAADHTGGTLYWLDDGRVRAANLDGMYPEVLVEHPNVGLSSLRLDLQARMMYWVDGNAGEILRANLDGTGVTAVGGGPGIAALAIDPIGGWMYWSETGPVEKIRRARLDGSERQDVFVFGSDASPTSLAVDTSAGRLYWVDGHAKTIARANTDGTGHQVLLTVTGTPFDIDLDPAGGKFYWTERSTNTIGRANLNGSGAETILANASPSIGGLAVLSARVPPFMNRRNGHLYYLTDEADDWWGVHADGIASGGTLAAVNDQEELDWILSALPLPEGNDDVIWLGGRDDAVPQWSWLTGEQFGFQAWGPSEPDGDPAMGESFLAMWTGGSNRGLWKDLYNHDLDNQGGAYGLIEFGCRADLSEDGNVDTMDVLLFLGAWVAGDPIADWNLDRQINTLDFVSFLNVWVVGC